LDWSKIMAIKINSSDTTRSGKTQYPLLKIDNEGLIILFTKEESGVVIRKETKPQPDTYQRYVGEFSDSWNESLFEIFTGKITLENE